MGLPFWIWLWVTGGILGLRCRLGGEQGPGEQNWSLCSHTLQWVNTCLYFLYSDSLNNGMKAVC